MTLISELLTRTLKNLSMMGGVSVQLYSEDIIVEKLRQAFNEHFDKVWWPAYMNWQVATLNGTTGVTVVNPTTWTAPLRQFKDIMTIQADEDAPALSPTPFGVVPARLQGTRALYFERDAANIFRVVPYTAIGDIHVAYKARPATFDLNADVLLDDELLIYAATFDYLTDDGSNPPAMQKAQSKYQERWRDIMRELSPTFATNERRNVGPITTWY